MINSIKHRKKSDLGSVDGPYKLYQRAGGTNKVSVEMAHAKTRLGNGEKAIYAQVVHELRWNNLLNYRRHTCNICNCNRLSHVKSFYLDHRDEDGPLLGCRKDAFLEGAVALNRQKRQKNVKALLEDNRWKRVQFTGLWH